MTAHEILIFAQQAGIALEARGDRLHVEAPAGTVTPELKDALVRRKVELLAVLAPVTDYVMLRGGLTLPLPALQLAWDLETRGFRVTLDAVHYVSVEPAEALTDRDRAAIHRWRAHLAAIVDYQAPEVPQ
jgi:hypothetical protein